MSELGAFLGEGWLGKVIVAGAAAVGGWLLRRPSEWAVVTTAIDGRVKTLLDAQKGLLDTALAQVAALSAARHADRAQCDQELADMREDMRLEREQLREEISRLMVGVVPGWGGKGNGDDDREG